MSSASVEVVMGFLLVLAQAQPSGDAARNAQQAGQGAAQIGQSVSNFFSMAASSQYGWIIGAAILFLVLRFFWRAAR